MLIHLVEDGYTGALTVAPLGDGLLCNRHASGEAATAGHDQLVRIGVDASLTAILDLSEHQLVWETCPTGSTGPVLLNVDHQIQVWNPETAVLRRLSENSSREPASFLSVAGTRAAWYADGEVVVHDFASREDVFRHPLVPQLHGGHTTQMAGALSPDGKRLACCAQAGEIRWFDISTGTLLESWRQDFEMIEHMQFSADGRWLFASETYGSWRLLRFDVASGQSIHAPGIDMARGDFAVEPTGTRLAVAAYGQVSLFEGTSLEELARFRVDQVARTFRLAWMDANAIGVRTDLGFAGIYAI
jgi:WD40 repeat protein